MTRKEITLASLVLLVLLALAGCGATPEAQWAMERSPAEPMVEQVIVETEAKSVYAPGGETSATDVSQVQVERMIIWNAAISLKVKDAQEAMQQVQAMARDLGGYTVGSESWLSDDQLHARLTIRVPAGQFEEAMTQLRGLALKVDRESADSEDVTDQYVDLQSRLRHLEAKEAQLTKFLEEAEDTEGVLAVYEHLAETQAEIEQVKGRMAYLEKLSAMATITVELYPEEAEAPVVEEGWKPGRTLRSAARTLVNTLESLADAAIWFAIYVLPVLLLIALPILVLVWVVRRWRRRRRGHAPPA
jgi:hypothetical protein